MPADGAGALAGGGPSPDMPLVTRLFDHYYRSYVEPNRGAFHHHAAHFWPMGLELTRLLAPGPAGRRTRYLGWTLSNETLPGTYALAEQVNPAHNGISGGDMPHAWAAADPVTLIREMLITEQDDALVLLPAATGGSLKVEKSACKSCPRSSARSLRTHSTVVRRRKLGGTLTLWLAGSVRRRLSLEGTEQPQAVTGLRAQLLDGWLTIPHRWNRDHHVGRLKQSTTGSGE